MNGKTSYTISINGSSIAFAKNSSNACEDALMKSLRSQLPTPKKNFKDWSISIGSTIAPRRKKISINNQLISGFGPRRSR
jgi:hypothetical protein